MWKWSARRSGLEGKIEHFDARFRWPFIATFVLTIVGLSFMFIGVILQKFFGTV